MTVFPFKNAQGEIAHNVLALCEAVNTVLSAGSIGGHKEL